MAIVCAIGFGQADSIAAKAGADTAHNTDADYSSWAVDPTAPGPDVPPSGRSLFDYLVTERIAGKTTYRIPFPFSALVDRIQSTLGQKEYLGGTRIAMIPMGRSLQRSAAAPDFFKYPRIVFAVTGEPALSERDAGALFKDRLYLGYVEKTGMLEVISYNESAGRFEFQLVKDYRPGAQPKVFYANRAICISCHQNHAPIFSQAIWSESNANGKVAALLRAQRSDIDLSAQANIDFPDDIDKSTVRANTMVTLQSVWQRGCADARDRLQSQRCRAAALTAILQYGLSGEQDHAADSPGYQSSFVATLARVWRQEWPQGLGMAQSSLPDRNPFGNAGSYYGGGGAEDGALDWIAASNVPAQLDPLNPRPAREIWRFAGAMDAYRFIPGWTKFFTADDFRVLDAHLRQPAGSESARRSVFQAQCSAVPIAPGATGFKLECASDTATHGVALAGRFDKQGSGRLTWLNFGPAGSLRDLQFDGEAARRAGPALVLRAVPGKNGLAPRLADGRRLASVEIRWPAGAAEANPSKPIEARFEVVVLDDFEFVRQAIDRLLATQPSLFDDGPLVRAELLRALFSELGIPERSWCCVDDRDMPPALLDLPEVNASAISKREWQPFFRYCAVCHQTREQFPPNFLSGDAAQVEENLLQCAPRMLVRLAAWGTPVEQRVKSPMPPATALPGLGITTHRWAGSEELAMLRTYVEGLSRRAGQAATVVELLKDGYEALPRCLPAAN